MALAFRRDVLLLIVGAIAIISFLSMFGPMPAPGSWVPNSTGSVAVDDAAAAVNPYPDFAAPKQSNKPAAKPPPAVNDFKASRGGHSLPVTRLIAHAPGWTIFENLYMSNGTLFVLTDEDQSRWPQIRLMTSTGLPAENTPENIQAREPTKDNMDFLGPYEARKRWSGGVWGVEGTTFLFNEPAQFIAHYYHGCAELLFGAWSFYAGTYDPHITERGETTVPPVTRAIFTHSEANRWRDGSRFNAYFLYSAFPSISLEGQEDWDDRIFMTRSGQRAWVFERVMLTDRSASFRGEFCGGRNQRIASEAYEAVKDRASKWWWEPMRRSVLKFAGVEDDILDLSLRYNSPEKPKPVISYISRQAGGRRMLIEKDHEGLVAAVQKMADQRGWEFNVVNAQHMTQEEQILMAARTTVMLGVHGNGLTHLLHMAQTPVSTVIEIFYPGGFAHDYEWTTLALGMKHFAVWNDTYYAEPNAPNVDYPDGKNDDGGFQGNHIPVHGPAVAQLIADRLDGKLP